MTSWSIRRRIIYFTGVAGFFLAIALGFYLVYKPQPTCFDGIMNQNEVGVDCGGVCVLACEVQLVPLKTLWVRPLEVRPGVYDVAAFVENANQNFGAQIVNYTMRIADDKNITIRERRGKTYINPGERFIVFESGIETGERVVKQAFISFDDGAVPWERITSEPPKISVTTQPFSNGPRPSLTISLTNTTVYNLENVDVKVVLSDSEQNAFAASSSFLKELGQGETREVVFTWPHEFKTQPSFIDVYPLVNMFEFK